MVCVFWYSYIFTHIRRLVVVKMFYEPTWHWAHFIDWAWWGETNKGQIKIVSPNRERGRGLLIGRPGERGGKAKILLVIIRAICHSKCPLSPRKNWADLQIVSFWPGSQSLLLNRKINLEMKDLKWIVQNGVFFPAVGNTTGHTPRSMA